MGKTFNREEVLRKTLWGVNIYSHILRRFYPNELVMKITGRDCGIVRNPFTGGVQSLHIWYDKNNPDVKLSDETARHHDENCAIPDGGALDFAELYYHQSGQELLDTLNREMYLHLDEECDQYGHVPVQQIDKGSVFSFFKAPITNKYPLKSITVADAYNYIKGHYAAEETSKLRSFTDKKQAKLYKQSHFAYATFRGEVEYRSNDSVKTESRLLCIDFDHLTEIGPMKQKLFEDQYFETALLFRSPSGDGLKWVIEINRGNLSHSDFFRAVENYILKRYGVQIDRSGKDISLACFLPHDPEAYINPNYV